MDEEPLSLDDFRALLPLAGAWRDRRVSDAPHEELVALVQAVEPYIEALNDFLDDQAGPPERWPPAIQALKALADAFSEAAFEDAVWEAAFPNGPEP